MNDVLKELNKTSSKFAGIKANGLGANLCLWVFLTVVVCVLGVEGLKLFLG